MARTIDRHSADLRDELPDPGETPRERLRHTLAAHANTADDNMAVHATGGVYGDGVHTGVTYGDLRAISEWLDKSEEHLRPDHRAFR